MSPGQTEWAVLDASVVLPILLKDPRGPACAELILRLSEKGVNFTSPTLFAYETTNGLTRARLAGQIEDREGEAALQTIDDLDIRMVVPDLELRRRAFEWTRDLGRAAAYDSFYLALAERHACDLWVTDGRLARAADLPWVRLVSELAP